MKKTLFIILLFTCISSLSAEKTTLQLLNELDVVISERQKYADEKETRIKYTKESLKKADTEEQKYSLYCDLINDYKSFNTDSTLLYAQLQLKSAQQLNNQCYIDLSQMNISEVMYLTGMYKEALERLNSVNRTTLDQSLLPFYFHLYRTLYGQMADYSITEQEKNEYQRLINLYRDSILVVNPESSLIYTMVKADKYSAHNEYDKALNILYQYMEEKKPENHDLALITYCLALAYGSTGDKEKEKRNFIISATHDLKSATKEHISLRRLAYLLYEEGSDIKRSYNYLKCSLEDANYCNARLRTIEASTIFPIIEKSYQQETSRQKEQLVILLVCISILSVFLILAIYYVYKQMKKLSVARHEVSLANNCLHILNSDLQNLNNKLQCSNQKLQDTNFTLSDSNYIKDEYIGKYMDQCSIYLDKMENYRRNLNKIAVTEKPEKLFKAIKSSQFIEDELKEFYDNFDETFLNLFPGFVEQFNALLVEKESIQLKPGERLNTELRIYALIRLGITDSTKIAHFLRYSVTTIYNYRTKLRNKAAGERDEFEKKVMKIGKTEE